MGVSLVRIMRFGQGGARLESGSAEAPLTDALADNERWILGVMYMDPTDPAVMVEARFGTTGRASRGCATPWRAFSCVHSVRKWHDVAAMLGPIRKGSMVIWKPPAFLIIFGTFAVFFLGLGAVLVNLLGVLPPGDQAGAVMSAAWGASIILADVSYRRRTELPLFDMSRSTVFFIVPTWVVGIVVIVWGQSL